MRIVIVGAGLAGFRTVQALRTAGFSGPVSVVGAEKHSPYDRPPLSKGVLSGEVQDVSLGPVDADLLLGNAAVGLDKDGRKVALADGTVLGYDHLVIATGLSARPMPGALTLRTLEDASAIRSAMTEPARLVVVGAGVLGCEIAATFRSLGHPVTLIEPCPGPLWQALNGSVACDLIGQWHENHGVTTLFDTSVTDVRDGVVHLQDGREAAGDVVVAAIGGVPNVAWLDGSGIETGDGVVCGPDCAVAPGIWAVGDVAHVRGSGRVEHWTSAGEMASVVAANILGGQSVHQPSTYFWSDQYGLKLQALGSTAGEATLVRSDPETGKFLVVYGESGTFSGVVGAGHARAVVGSRMTLGKIPVTEAVSRLS
ncbi:FAD-dependent oxidoreductase [Actinocrispum sp. NPDC049592]|uniref:NAD(P)/FAD-dependent oxidoreductase n=1 Tax=Actinocrispum sp. NPDC049592 TaxID=3154835 RepID=UPI003422784F